MWVSRYTVSGICKINSHVMFSWRPLTVKDLFVMRRRQMEMEVYPLLFVAPGRPRAVVFIHQCFIVYTLVNWLTLLSTIACDCDP